MKYSKDWFDSLDLSIKIRVWNEYVVETRQSERYVYDNDPSVLNDMYHDNASELARAVSFGRYNYYDSYFVVNVYGNIHSYAKYDVVEQAIDVDEMLEHFNENDDAWTHAIYEWSVK